MTDAIATLRRYAHEAVLHVRKAAEDVVLAERRITSILDAHYQREFLTPAAELVDDAVSLMPSVVPLGRTDALLDQLGDLGAAMRLTETEEDGLAAASERIYRVERTEMADLLQSTATWGIVDDAAVEWLGVETPFWIGKHYRETTSDQIRAIGAGLLSVDGASIDDVRDRLMQTLGRHHDRSRDYWDMLAVNAVTRGRNYGSIGSMEQAEIREYELLNPGDGRTSDICELLNGTVYTVEEAVAQRDAVIGSTPDEMVAIAPWLSFARISAMHADGGRDALSAAGVRVPPFHGRCRTVLSPRF